MEDGERGLPGEHAHGHGADVGAREFEHRGHRVQIVTHYVVTIDGERWEQPMQVHNDGTVTCHGLPQYVVPSAVGLVRAVIDGGLAAQAGVDAPRSRASVLGPATCHVWYPPADTFTSVARRHPRIQVPGDPELQRAIARGRELAGPGAPASQVVRALALRGAEALEADEAAGQRAREFLVEVAEGRSGLDLARLRTVRERAWR